MTRSPAAAPRSGGGSGRASDVKRDLARVDLHWLPLGAGGHSVRWNGRAFETLAALREHRHPADLYHSALEVFTGPDRYVLEMTPSWGGPAGPRGVVREGPVGFRRLGVSRVFRYEVRCWRDGTIPDLADAVGGPRRVSTDLVRARRLLSVAPSVPALTWGRDELGTGDMWNSNSIVAWVLASSGHDTGSIAPPRGGRAPGWSAGLVAAARGLPPATGGVQLVRSGAARNGAQR